MKAKVLFPSLALVLRRRRLYSPIWGCAPWSKQVYVAVALVWSAEKATEGVGVPLVLIESEVSGFVF